MRWPVQNGKQDARQLQRKHHAYVPPLVMPFLCSSFSLQMGLYNFVNIFNQWIFGKVRSKNVVVSCTLRAWPTHYLNEESARDNHVLVCNFAKCSPIKKNFTDRLNNKLFLIWLLATPSHLKYVATLPCNFSSIACFLILMFHHK